MVILTALVAANFVGPEVTLSAFLFSIVDVKLSIALAVAYVEKYREKMRRNGRDRRNPCGRRNAFFAAPRRDSERLAFVAAFRTIDLGLVSMIEEF